MKLKKFAAVIFALMTVFSLAFSLSACSGNDDGTFVVGFDSAFPPMGYTDDDGKYVGFDLDLAAEVAERNGWKLKLQPIDWKAKDNELNSGTIDCIWNGFTKSEERLDKYAWTDAYMNNRQIVVVKGDSPYQTFEDLKGKIVCAQEDSSALTAIDNNADFKALIKEVVQTDSNQKALMELEVGAVEAVVMDECVAIYNIDKMGKDFRILDEAVGSEEFAVGFKLGNEALRDKVQNTLFDMVKDGKMAEISNKWFDKDITTLGK